MKRAHLLLPLLLAGCSSAPETRAPLPERAARPVEGALPDAGLVAAFATRFDRHRDAPACERALARDHEDLAHALWLQAEDDALRARLAQALSRTTLAYADSERARRTAPEAHARARAALLRAIAAGSREDAEAAAAASREAGDALLAREAARVLELIERGAARLPEALTLTARRDLARRHVERRQPLEALRHAATLVREQGEAAPAADRLLLARAHQLAAQTEQALAEALTACDDAKRARELRTEAAAHALVAELMLDLQRPDAAADEFDAAERLFVQAGDPEGRLRQAVNRAGVLLGLKQLDDAQGALSPVLGLSLPGEAGADLTCRRDVTAALIDLVAGRTTGAEATRRVEQALDIARAAGAYQAVEQYASLPARLRPGPM